jgi:DnaJ-class molecular chaperone
MSKKHWHKILGVSPNASQSEIKQAFRRLAIKLHPDQGGNRDKFVELRQAYDKAIKIAPKTKQKSQAQYSSTAASAYDNPIGANPPYDPFLDPDYDKYSYFQPDNPKLEGFERSLRAKDCKLCGGKGTITKLVHPEMGFFGLQTRYCRCQRI